MFHRSASVVKMQAIAALQSQRHSVDLFDADEIDKLYVRFETLDKKSAGRIGERELASLPELQANPIAHRIMKILFGERDQIDFTKFCDFLAIFSPKQKRDVKLDFAFRVYDVDGDGFISRSDLEQVLTAMVGKSLDKDQVIALANQTISEFDQDNDSALSLFEFKRAMFDSDIEKILVIEV